jgi:hypothetical protein
MNQIKILERAFDIVKRYRALWLFGVLLAITSAGGGSGGGNSGGQGAVNFGRLPRGSIPEPIAALFIPTALGIVLMVLLLGIAAIILRYIARTALIRMVNDHEASGCTYTIREGFRLGWSKESWHVFLINLLIGIPLFLLFGGLLIATLLPLILWITENRALGILGTIMTVGLFFIFIFMAILVGTIVKLLKRFFWRACILEGLSVTDAIRQGFEYVWGNLGEVGLMWLLMVGVKILWGIAILITGLLLLILGGMLGGIPAILIGALSRFVFGSESLSLVLGGLAFAPVFLLVVIVPLVFFNGLMEAFISSTWTLTYREIASALTTVATTEAS